MVYTGTGSGNVFLLSSFLAPAPPSLPPSYTCTIVMATNLPSLTVVLLSVSIAHAYTAKKL